MILEHSRGAEIQTRDAQGIPWRMGVPDADVPTIFWVPRNSTKSVDCFSQCWKKTWGKLHTKHSGT